MAESITGSCRPFCCDASSAPERTLPFAAAAHDSYQREAQARAVMPGETPGAPQRAGGPAFNEFCIGVAAALHRRVLRPGFGELRAPGGTGLAWLQLSDTGSATAGGVTAALMLATSKLLAKIRRA